MIPAFALRWLDALKARKFERLFSGAEDPFRYSLLEFERRRLETMRRVLSDKRYGAAVEFGCACGHFTRLLAPLCDRLQAMDLASGAVARARQAVRGHAHVEISRGNLRTWEPAEGTVLDLVVLSEILYYLGERNDLLKAVASDPDAYVKPVLERLRRRLAARGRILLAHSYGPGRRADRVRYRLLLESMGMRLVAEEEIAPTGEPGTDNCLVSLLELPS